jgi:TrpR-related protein YerC/YecD
MCALVGLITAMTNGIPMHAGPVDNDGYNILSLKKSEEALKGFWLQMKAAGQSAQGVRLRDMPEEWFFMPSRAMIKNSMCASAGVFTCSRIMDQMKFEEALQAMNTLLRTGSGMVPLHRASVQMDKACCQLLLGKEKEVAERSIDATCKKLMKAMKTNISVIRTEYVFALLGEKDEKIRALLQLIVEVDNLEDCQALFDDLCTRKELEKMAERVYAAKLLMEGKTYNQVISQADISSATLSRVSRCVQYGTGYKKLLK